MTVIRLAVNVSPELHRALRVLAATEGDTVTAIVTRAIEAEILAGGAAKRVRQHLASEGLLELAPGGLAEVDLAIGKALRDTAGVRAQVAAVARALDRSEAVVELYGTEVELRRAVRAALSGTAAGVAEGSSCAVAE